MPRHREVCLTTPIKKEKKCVHETCALGRKMCTKGCLVWGCCSVLQCVAVCCSVLQCVAVCSYMSCRASIWDLCIGGKSVLQCVAVCCSVLQCVAVCCSVFYMSCMTSIWDLCIGGKSVLQCVVLCCSVLQRVLIYLVWPAYETCA